MRCGLTCLLVRETDSDFGTNYKKSAAFAAPCRSERLKLASLLQHEMLGDVAVGS
jgi:hypothetical protein